MILLIYIVVMLIVIAGAVFVAWLRQRTLRTRTIIHTLSLVVGQNLPLAAGLRAAAAQERRALRRILENIARRLEVGDALSTALRCAHLSCPGRIIGAIQGAELGGTLPSVLRSLAADEPRYQIQTVPGAPPLAYLLLVPVALPLIVTFVMVVVVPKFKEIFYDFGIMLPPITAELISISATIRDYYAPTVVLLVILGGAVLHYGISRHFMARVPDRFQYVPALTDTLAWYLPVFRQVTQARAWARQLPLLQAAIRTGQDLPAAARQAACVDANFHARRRLREWADAIEAGGEPVHEAQRCGFPRPLLSALATGHSPEELGAALEYVGTYYRGMVTHWSRVLGSIIMPCVVVLWGICVAYFVVAMIIPLAALVNAVAASAY